MYCAYSRWGWHIDSRVANHYRWYYDNNNSVGIHPVFRVWITGDPSSDAPFPWDMVLWRLFPTLRYYRWMTVTANRYLPHRPRSTDTPSFFKPKYVRNTRDSVVTTIGGNDDEKRLLSPLMWLMNHIFVTVVFVKVLYWLTNGRTVISSCWNDRWETCNHIFSEWLAVELATANIQYNRVVFPHERALL